MNNSPFFIVGCVRSGTTLLRNVLRRHPHLASPEETHFFRWAEPFGGIPFRRMAIENRVLKRHREMDGISEAEFEMLVDQSASRAELCRRYMRLYIDRNKPEAQRWFDKTPQNVYGAALIAGEIPEAKFIHIVRHPLDVIASLRIGVVVKVQNLIAACSYWNEAAAIINVVKTAYPKRVYELRYEDFTREPLAELEKILGFLGESYDPKYFRALQMKPKTHDHNELFSEDELAEIKWHCRYWGAQYGYFDR